MLLLASCCATRTKVSTGWWSGRDWTKACVAGAEFFRSELPLLAQSSPQIREFIGSCRQPPGKFRQGLDAQWLIARVRDGEAAVSVPVSLQAL